MPSVDRERRLIISPRALIKDFSLIETLRTPSEKSSRPSVTFSKALDYADAWLDHMQELHPNHRGVGESGKALLAVKVYWDIVAGKHERRGQ